MDSFFLHFIRQPPMDTAPCIILFGPCLFQQAFVFPCFSIAFPLVFWEKHFPLSHTFCLIVRIFVLLESILLFIIPLCFEHVLNCKGTQHRQQNWQGPLQSVKGAPCSKMIMNFKLATAEHSDTKHEAAECRATRDFPGLWYCKPGSSPQCIH